MNENIFRQIKSKLKSEFYSMNNEWLRDCIEFYVDQHKNSSPQEILQFVKVQWQLSDLREINNENGSLPHNLSEQKFIVLNENYILQVEQMYDIAMSKYKQLEQIRNTHISEVELSEAEKMEKWEPPKKRMMQLRLTDGLQDVIGIEYSYISQLNDMLLPGYKVMIMGPVKCRKGVLLLEEGKLKGIGGEVDSLLIPNALENVLARALNLPENPDPYNDNDTKSNAIKHEEPQIDDSFFEEDFEINFEDVSKIEDSHKKDNKKCNKYSAETEIKTKINTEIKTDQDHKNEKVFIDDDCFQTEIENTNTEIKIVNYETEKILDDDDCLLEMIDERQLIETQVEQKNITPFRTLPKEGNDDIIIINDEEVTDVKYDVSRKIEKKNSSHLNSKLFTIKSDSSVSRSKLKEKPKSLLTGEKRSVPSSPPEIVPLKKSKINRRITEFTKVINTPGEPKICEFIRDINNETVTETIFRTIRGHVEVVGKLTKKDSLWILEAVVADGTGIIEVSFSNKVLENLIGFSVQEFSLKKKLRKNPEIEHELRMNFRSAEQKVKTLDALLKLELNANKKPTVIEITDLTQEQKEVIDKQIKNFLFRNNI
ncbi:recQ-mediated genome instability protein 1-like [Frieseomelitta varia]|uniref:recQ-mediated genome instability protein 1-like n=1 Tax=Frieseomelitta varia TaxID=561572 RepID=UPI001CB684ED|nr:recQ-mediated genome instability protein 1-like [Frieseomelitta varia]